MAICGAGQRAARPHSHRIFFGIRAPGAAGMPAIMTFYNPMEIIVTPETTYILMSHNNDVYRRIYTDGPRWPADTRRTLVGYSIGRGGREEGGGQKTPPAGETH